MSRKTVVWVSIAVCAAAAAVAVAAGSRISIYVNGMPLRAEAIVRDGATYLPVRAVAEALGVAVRYDARTHAIYVRSERTKVNAEAALPRSGEAPSPTASPSAIEAARALAAKLSALASRVVAGINYRDYGVAVADIHEAWRRLGKQPGATAVPAYAALQAAMGEYDFAHEVWDYYFASGGRNDVLPASSPYDSRLIDEYGVKPKDVSYIGWKKEDLRIHLPTALTAIWARAHIHVEAAAQQLAAR